MPKKLVVICFVNFLIAALMGVALRFSFLESIGVNYRFLTHAHSHVAMLGWVYLMLFTLFVHYFVSDKLKVFNRLFWLTEFAVIGMMLSFPIQGYGAISISFATLHMLCSYCFVYLIWKHHKINVGITQKLLKTSLVFMVVSTFGVWCLGPIVSLLGSTSVLYHIAIQFFLHFQFNGWFLMAVLAVFFHLLKVENSKVFNPFFILLIASTIFTMALPIQWVIPHNGFIWLNGFGIVLQVLALYKFFQLITPKLHVLLSAKLKFTSYMYSFALVCLVLKILCQSLSILPVFAEEVYRHHNFVIGFIHLLMLGVISGFLLAFVFQSDVVKASKSLSVGVYCFILGFILTEILLLIQGVMFYFGIGILSNYYLLLFLFSTLLPLGIACIVFNIFRQAN